MAGVAVGVEVLVGVVVVVVGGGGGGGSNTGFNTTISAY